MKKLLLLATLSLAVPFGAFAQYWSAQPSTPQISVTGSAEVKVAPDEIELSVGVETRDAGLNVATRQNDDRIGKALKFLKDAGVPQKHVQTDYISVQPDYGPGNERTEPRFYIVQKSIEIKLTNMTNLETVLTGLLNNGVNNIHNVDFRTTELRKYRDQARAMAVRAAREKAQAMTKELDVKCGKPINITANESSSWYYPGSYWGGRRFGYSFNGVAQNASQNMGGAAGDSPSDTVSLGQISVSATVNVSFAIQ